MSLSPHAINGSRDGFRMGDAKMVDTMIIDGLWDVYNQYHMGVTAENVAKEYAVTREEQDRFALASQQKTSGAEGRRFKKRSSRSRSPAAKARSSSRRRVSAARHDARCAAGSQARLRQERQRHRGNASGINDGAAAVVLASSKKQENWIEAHRAHQGLRLRRRRPKYMGWDRCRRPSAACRAQVGAEGLDLMEINEAFAAQAIAVNRQWAGYRQGECERRRHRARAPDRRLGCRILVTLLHEMQKRDAKRGLASLASRRHGVALAVER